VRGRALGSPRESGMSRESVRMGVRRPKLRKQKTTMNVRKVTPLFLCAPLSELNMSRARRSAVFLLLPAAEMQVCVCVSLYGAAAVVLLLIRIVVMEN
jgi:hypothetical protein